MKVLYALLKICGTISAMILLLFSIIGIALSIKELNAELFIYGCALFCFGLLMIAAVYS